MTAESHAVTAERDELLRMLADLDQYRFPEGATLAGLIETYRAAARATDEAISALPDLNGTAQLGT